MANEISYQFQSLLNNAGLSDSFSSGSVSVDQATASLIRNVQLITQAAHVALMLGDVVTPGYVVFQNLDDTNYISIGIDVAGTFHEFERVYPGEKHLLRLGTTAPYALANTADANLFYIIYSN